MSGESFYSKIVDKAVNQRWLAYVSEVGESLRPLIPRPLVNAGYAISSGYVVAETIAFSGRPENKYKNIAFADRLIWHTFASMIFPALTVNRIVHGTHYLIERKKTKVVPFIFNLTKGKLPTYYMYRSIPTVVAMSAIPFIIHPIDNFVDFVMDKTIRKKY